MIRALIVGPDAATLGDSLARECKIECAIDVGAALNSVRLRAPELVVIAMPLDAASAALRDFRSDESLATLMLAVYSRDCLLLSARREFHNAGADLCLADPEECPALVALVRRLELRERAKLHADLWHRALFDANPQPMWVYDLETLRFVAVNDAAVAHYGYSRDEFLSMSIADIRPVEDLPRMYETIHAAAQGINQSGIWRHRKRNGELIDVEIASCPLRYNGRAAKLVMANDASNRKRAESDLRDREERLRLAVQAANIGLWDWTIGSVNANFSPEWKRLLGYEEHEIGSDVEEWRSRVHPEDLEPTLAYMAANTERPQHRDGIEFRMRHKNGSWRWIYSRGKVMRDAQGKPVLMIGGNVDITQRKQAEQQLAQSQKMQAIGTLAGGIAHDFNNVLAAIVGNARLAKAELSQGHAALVSIEEIIRAGHRARDLVQRILTFSRPQEYELKPMSLADVLDEAVKLLRPTIPAGVELRLSAAPNLPQVRADASQIHQVALNLATNAWHALPSAHGRIDIGVEACSVSAEQCTNPDLHPGSYVRLTVRDTGIGMDAATRARIFEPFFTTKAPGQGVGLGLSVVHGIVRAHGGAILVDSNPGSGSTFEVYFPAVYAEEAAEISALRAVESDALTHGGGERILYIDDEEALVYLAVRFLERHGYRVEGYADPAAALAAYGANPTQYDLVITDYNMPGISGMEVARKIMELNPAARIVLVSGYLHAAEIDAARALGVIDVVLKPNTIADLGPSVRQWLIARPAAA